GEGEARAENVVPSTTRTRSPTCRDHYPGGSSGCSCRLLLRSHGLHQMAGGSASALSLSRPAQASLTLRPAGSLSRPRRPLSRGSSPCRYPHEPDVSDRINRQLSGWILPPLLIRAFGAHCHCPTLLSGFCCGLRHFASVVDEELGGRPRCAVLERHDADWHGSELWLNA